MKVAFSSRLFVIACWSSVLCGAVFLASASRYLRAPDERDATPAPTAPVDYIRARPFDPLGYVALGDSLGDDLSASSLLLRDRAVRAAETLGPVEPQAVRAAAALAFARGEVGAGLDGLARYAAVSPGDRAAAFAALANYVTHPAWNAFASARLSAGWVDADAFLGALCTDPKSTKHAFAVAINFAKYRPIAPEVMNCVENRAIANGNVAGAYRLRLSAAKSLPKRIGFVFNGDFELTPSGSAFDWRVNAGGEYREGYVAAVRTDTGAGGQGKVLDIRFTHRPIQAPVAQQYLALPPARYQFSYLSKTSPLLGANGPIWKLVCAENWAHLLPDSWVVTDHMNGWTRHTASFAVAAGCSGQMLFLDAKSKLIALEGLRGNVSFDDVLIEQL